MSTRKEQQRKFQGRFGESGHFYFSLAQTESRFALCKEALLYERVVNLKFKKIYGSMRDVELCSIAEYESVGELSARYNKLDQLAYGGEFEKYDKQYCPEGALYPFVRVKGRKNYEIVDTGCIWVGTRFEYPRIFVDNDIANWLVPYSPGGFVRKDPFRPYAQVIQIMSKLTNTAHHPDLDMPTIL